MVINSGSVIETTSWSGYPDAVICAWQPGEEGGNSIADIITGKVNPSGKLTMTWPVAATDHPSTQNFPGQLDFLTFQLLKADRRPVMGHDYTNHEEDIYVGYRYFDTFQKTVAYPFGFGLSYTTFEYSKPVVKVNGDKVDISVIVKNTGSVAGKEVVQVYVEAPKGQIEKPAKELKAFGKTRELQPGESETLTMQVERRYLVSFDEAGSQWLGEAGNYLFLFGANVSDIRCQATAKLSQYQEPVSHALAPRQPLSLMRQ